MTTVVPFNDLRRHWAPFEDRLTDTAARVLRSGWYVLGPETEAFEDEFARFCDAAACAGLANGTDVLEVALRSLGCRRGHEVVVTGNAGMYATTAVLAIGAAPVFADIDPTTLLISPASAASLITDRTAAVVATHLYGNVVDVQTLRDALPRDVPIVEDGAQAHGASFDGRPVGSLGDVAAFSFYPTKNLGAVGDAGAVVSTRPELIAEAKTLRQYGWGSRYVTERPGGRNSRIDELQAAVLREFLPLVGHWNELRGRARARFVDALGDRIEFVGGTDRRAAGVAHLCVARVPERDRVRDAVRADGVTCEVHYPLPDHRQPALRRHRVRTADLAQTDRACREVLSLPCFPEIDEREITTVIDTMRRCT